MKKKLRLIEMRINPDRGSDVSAISLVGRPAIGSNFVAFSEDEVPEVVALAFEKSEEKMELLGAAMVPNHPMYRNTKGIGEYISYFTAETIRFIAQTFAERGYFSNMNIGHSDKPAGSFVFQSYIVDSTKGINAPTSVQVPDGSWIVGVKVNDPEIWAEISAGQHNGFSVEGLFGMLDTMIEIEMSEEIEVADPLAEEFEVKLLEYFAEPKGCLMFFPEVDYSQFDQRVRMLNPGATSIESEPHVTILYGFMDSPEIPDNLKLFMAEALNKNPLSLELGRVSKFINETQDVVKIDVLDTNGSLYGINLVLADIFGVVSDYDRYEPHLTLCYTPSDPTKTFSSERVYPWEFGIESLNRGRIIYSDAAGVQTEILVIK